MQESERKLGSKKRKAEDSDSESSDEYGPMPVAKPAAKKVRKRKGWHYVGLAYLPSRHILSVSLLTSTV